MPEGQFSIYFSSCRYIIGPPLN